MAAVVVVGGGLAGVRTCQELRLAGWTGTIELISAEPVAPYDRPPLSKQPHADVDLRTAMGLDVFAMADHVHLACPAHGLLRPRGPHPLRVTTSDGPIHGDAVVVATGADPVLPAAWAGQGVHVLRTRADSNQIWDGLVPGSRLLVIGGGWIGCELAITAAHAGARVLVAEAGPQVLADLPMLAADRVRDLMLATGVEVLVDSPVQAVTREPGAAASWMAQIGGLGARQVDADLVVAGLGVRPSTGWLAGSGIELDPTGAVVVDRWGRTGCPGVVAVGDAAVRRSARFGRMIPSGHWTEAMQAPATVAAWIVEWAAAGADVDWLAPPRTPAWDPIPYIFSELGAVRVLVLGDAAGRHARQAVELIWREGGGTWTCFTTAGDRLLGVSSTRPRDVVAARRAMLADAHGAPQVDHDALADPAAGPHSMFPEGRAG